jgi:hypothetical protein
MRPQHISSHNSIVFLRGRGVTCWIMRARNSWSATPVCMATPRGGYWILMMVLLRICRLLHTVRMLYWCGRSHTMAAVCLERLSSHTHRAAPRRRSSTWVSFIFESRRILFCRHATNYLIYALIFTWPTARANERVSAPNARAKYQTSTVFVNRPCT